MGDAFGADVLSGSECSGYRPWLGNREHDCSETKRTLQRGGSNVHFPVVCSTLSIPPDSEAINQILEELRMVLDATPPEAIPHVLQGIAANYDIDGERLVRAWQQINAGAAGYAGLTEKMARSEEYAALGETKHDDPIGHIVPQFENTVLNPPAALAPYFDIIGAVSRLREVRALAGFSRIEPYPVSAENVAQAIADGKVSPLSKTSRNWLPGAEIRGEGIFLRFRTDVIDEWAKKQGIALAQRIAEIEARSQAVADKRGYTRDYAITARLLVVHAFAHALIRQISVECGYSAAALRERLFVSEPEGSRAAENGVLIYTGSPDSEGSLGGLVRLAEPDLLEPIVLRALQNSGWCGSDPVCLETEPSQSGDRVSGAACHCCLLLPETACEKFNRELDRTMLVGSADRSFQGFFHELLEQLEWQS